MVDTASISAKKAANKKKAPTYRRCLLLNMRFLTERGALK